MMHRKIRTVTKLVPDHATLTTYHPCVRNARAVPSHSRLLSAWVLSCEVEVVVASDRLPQTGHCVYVGHASRRQSSHAMQSLRRNVVPLATAIGARTVPYRRRRLATRGPVS